MSGPNWEDGSGSDAGGRFWVWKKCKDWPNADVNTCNSRTDAVGWMKCGIGSNPSAGLCSPFSDSFNCAWGQDCYAIIEKPEEVSWEKPSGGCDGKGNRITLQKCNNWMNNDPKSCLRSAKNIIKLNEELKTLNAKQEKTTDDTDRIKYIEDYIKDKPITIKWANCGIGSSPGGIYPGDGATACSPFSQDVDNGFGCMWGQSCFAITEDKKDPECPISFFTDPILFIVNFWEKNKVIIIIVLVVLIVLSSISAVLPTLLQAQALSSLSR